MVGQDGRVGPCPAKHACEHEPFDGAEWMIGDDDAASRSRDAREIELVRVPLDAELAKGTRRERLDGRLVLDAAISLTDFGQTGHAFDPRPNEWPKSARRGMLERQIERERV
jgi:hypothetical protein